MTIIDKIEESDLAELSALYEELSGVKTNMKKMKDSYEFINRNLDYILIGAKDDNKNLVGSLLGIICHDVVGECRPFMVLENVIVKSSCRGLGVGKSLINYILKNKKSKGDRLMKEVLEFLKECGTFFIVNYI